VPVHTYFLKFLTLNPNPKPKVLLISLLNTGHNVKCLISKMFTWKMFTSQVVMTSIFNSPMLPLRLLKKPAYPYKKTHKNLGYFMPEIHGICNTYTDKFEGVEM
jgi:hypothetical protein